MAKLPVLPRSPKGEITFSLSSLQSTTNASDYVLEQRVQKAYHHLLFDGLQDLYGRPGPEALTYLVETVFADYFTQPSKRQRDGRSQRHLQAEERLQYDIPELICQLPRPELEALHALLSQRNLIGAIRLVWYELRPKLHKFTPSEHLPDDSKLYYAAGLGQARPTVVASAPCCPHATVTALLSVLAPLTTPHSPPGRTLLPDTGRRLSLALPVHHLRVKRAQERKRLKRKRR